MEDLKLHRSATVHGFKDGEASKDDVFLKDLKVVADLTARHEERGRQTEPRDDKSGQVMTRE